MKELFKPVDHAKSSMPSDGIIAEAQVSLP